MRTTVNVDDELLSRAMRETRAATKSEMLRLVLQEFLRERKKRALLALRGKVDIADDLRELRALDARE